MLSTDRTKLPPCKAMGCYIEIPEALETKRTLKAAASSQSITEQLDYLGQGTLLMWDPAALSLPHQLLKPLPGVPSLENSWQEQCLRLQHLDFSPVSPPLPKSTVLWHSWQRRIPLDSLS